MAHDYPSWEKGFDKGKECGKRAGLLDACDVLKDAIATLEVSGFIANQERINFYEECRSIIGRAFDREMKRADDLRGGVTGDAAAIEAAAS